MSRPRIACIGRREVMDKLHQAYMMEIGTYLAVKGYIVSTGNADGADFFFMEGARHVNPQSVEVHLPWPNYNQVYIQEGYNIIIDGDVAEYHSIAAALHPNWKTCNQAVRKLHARNVGIIRGCNQVIAYPRMSNHGDPMGGTGMGIRIAQHLNIPVINLSIPSVFKSIMDKVNTM